MQDYENMVDEQQLEPDYFIDRPPAPVYVPNPDGDNKDVQVFDKDDDLFDFELEAEPILEVLVGKALECARIEVLEEYEDEQQRNHRRGFKQTKEAQLMET
jgi:hypothetical protein